MINDMSERFEGEPAPRNVPRLLLVGDTGKMNAHWLAKILELERSGEIVILYQNVECGVQDYSFVEDRVNTILFDELYSDTYLASGGTLVKRKVERKVKPYYRKGERW